MAVAHESIDARIARAATTGIPVITRRRLREAGVNRARVASRLADGRLTHAWSDTLLVGRHDLRDVPLDLLRRAAVATVEPNAALGGVSAIERLCGWRRFEDEIHVISDRWHEDLPRHRITFRRAREAPSADDIALVDQVPTFRPLPAMLQAARDCTAHQAANAIAELEYHTPLELDDVADAIDGGGRIIGAPVLRRAVALRRSGSVGTRGRSEDQLLPYVTARRGEPVVNVRGAAGIPDYEPDMLWRKAGCIVEVDGGHHVDDPAIRAADLERDRLLKADGWCVVRIRWRRVWRDLPGVLRDIDDAFARRKARVAR